MKRKDDQIRIDAYLQNQMTASERQAFETELAMNQHLMEQLKRQEIELKIMEALVENDLKKDLKNWQKEAEENQTITKTEEAPKPLYRKLPFILVAASLAFLVSLFIWTNQQTVSSPSVTDANPTIENSSSQEESTPEEKQIQNNSPANAPGPNTNPSQKPVDNNKSNQQKEKTDTQNLPPKISKPNYFALVSPYLQSIDFGKIQTRDEASPLGEALTELQEKRFDSGNQKLLALLQQEPKNLNAQYYLGLSYFEQKQYRAAIPYLYGISNAVYLHSETAEWWLCMAYLQQKENDKAITLLKTIQQDEEHIHYENAVALLEKIMEKQ